MGKESIEMTVKDIHYTSDILPINLSRESYYKLYDQMFLFYLFIYFFTICHRKLVKRLNYYF